MVLPINAALERVPKSVIEASSDLGARPGYTFRKVILPLAVPGVVAGSIFTFSLTLGDYIIPQVVGNPYEYGVPGAQHAVFGAKTAEPVGADELRGMLSEVVEVQGAVAERSSADLSEAAKENLDAAFAFLRQWISDT